VLIRGGLARMACWAFLFSNYAIKDWVTFAEAYGQPLRVGKYDVSATPQDIETLLMALRSLGTDAAARSPRTWRSTLSTPATRQPRSISMPG
jgi:phage gp29-like protein